MKNEISSDFIIITGFNCKESFIQNHVLAFKSKCLKALV